MKSKKQTWIDTILDKAKDNKLVYKGLSDIHGYGLFARKNIPQGKVIGPAFIKINDTGITDNDYRYTYIGRWINHSSKNYNVRSVAKNNIVYFQAIKNISPGHELVINYKLLPFFEGF